MGIRSMLRKVFGRDREDSPATSVPPQSREETVETTEPAEAVTASETSNPVTPATPATPEAPAAPAAPEEEARRAADDLVAASFDNPQVPKARKAEPEPEPVVVEEPTPVAPPEPEAVTEPAPAPVPVPVPEEPEATAVEVPAEPETATEVPEAEPTAAVEEKAPEAEPQAEAPAEPAAAPAPEEQQAEQTTDDTDEPQAREAAPAEPETTTPEAQAEPEPETAEATKAQAAPETAEVPEVQAEPEATVPEIQAAPEPEPAEATKAQAAPEATTPEVQAEPEAPAAAPEPEATAPEPEATAPVITVREPEAPAAPEDVAPAAAGPVLSLAKVKAVAPHLADAYKAAGAALKKQGLAGARAAVYLVVDRSGSMRGYFKDGSVQRLAEQTVALAAHLDENAAVTAVFFSTDIDGTAELTPATLSPTGIEEINAGLGRLGRTHYHRAVEEVLAHHEKTDPTRPALVVFQTDGAPDAKTAATQALAGAADRPLHWRFVAWGEEDNKAFDYLRKLGTPRTAAYFPGATPAETAHAAFYRGLLEGLEL
ncbi:VWA domain-containing protein [Streptomyces cinereoruber]